MNRMRPFDSAVALPTLGPDTIVTELATIPSASESFPMTMRLVVVEVFTVAVSFSAFGGGLKIVVVVVVVGTKTAVVVVATTVVDVVAARVHPRPLWSSRPGESWW